MVSIQFKNSKYLFLTKLISYIRISSIIIFVFSVSSCKEHKDNPNLQLQVQIVKGLNISPVLDSLINKYITEEPNASAYAIFIDKRYEGMSDYMVTIAPFSKKINNIYETGTANYFILKGSTPVFIYSGIEDFLVSKEPQYNDARQSIHDASGEFKNIDYFKKFIDLSKGLSYVHQDNKTFVVKGNFFPFMDMTLKQPVVMFDTNYLRTHKTRKNRE